MSTKVTPSVNSIVTPVSTKATPSVDTVVTPVSTKTPTAMSTPVTSNWNEQKSKPKANLKQNSPL